MHGAVRVHEAGCCVGPCTAAARNATVHNWLLASARKVPPDAAADLSDTADVRVLQKLPQAQTMLGIVYKVCCC